VKLTPRRTFIAPKFEAEDVLRARKDEGHKAGAIWLVICVEMLIIEWGRLSGISSAELSDGAEDGKGSKKL
jgi:hypothetical protein